MFSQKKPFRSSGSVFNVARFVEPETLKSEIGKDNSHEFSGKLDIFDDCSLAKVLQPVVFFVVHSNVRCFTALFDCYMSTTQPWKNSRMQ